MRRTTGQLAAGAGQPEVQFVVVMALGLITWVAAIVTVATDSVTACVICAALGVVFVLTCAIILASCWREHRRYRYR